MDRFIERRIASGQYGDASEVVREGLRLLEHREGEDRAKLRWLQASARQALDQLDRGEGLEIDDFDSYLDRLSSETSVPARKREK